MACRWRPGSARTVPSHELRASYWNAGKLSGGEGSRSRRPLTRRPWPVHMSSISSRRSPHAARGDDSAVVLLQEGDESLVEDVRLLVLHEVTDSRQMFHPRTRHPAPARLSESAPQ